MLAYSDYSKLQDEKSMHFLDRLNIASNENYSYIATNYTIISMSVVNAVNNTMPTEPGKSTLPDKIAFIVELASKTPKIRSQKINQAPIDSLFTEFLQRISDEDIESSINNPTPFGTILRLSIINENLFDPDLKIELYKILEAQCKAVLQNYDSLTDENNYNPQVGETVEELLISVNQQLVTFLEQMNHLISEHDSGHKDEEEDDDDDIYYKENLPSLYETIRQIIVASINTMIYQFDSPGTLSMPPKTVMKISHELLALIEQYFVHLRDSEEEIPVHFIEGYRDVNEALMDFIISKSLAQPAKEVMLFNDKNLDYIKKYLDGLSQESVKNSSFIACRLDKYKSLLREIQDMMRPPINVNSKHKMETYDPVVLEYLLSAIEQLQTKNYRPSSRSLKL